MHARRALVNRFLTDPRMATHLTVSGRGRGRDERGAPPRQGSGRDQCSPEVRLAEPGSIDRIDAGYSVSTRGPTGHRTAYPDTGLLQRISVKRAKSVSAEQTSRPCWIASAARCAIRDQVAGEPVFADQRPQHVRVPLRRTRGPDRRHGEPVVHVAPGLNRAQGSCGRTRMSHDADERRQRFPRHADPLIAVQRLRQPCCRTGVGGCRGIDRVDQHVCVDEHQRPAGPSSSSSASVTFVTSTISCSGALRWRKADRTGLTVRPARASLLTASLTPSPRSDDDELPGVRDALRRRPRLGRRHDGCAISAMSATRSCTCWPGRSRAWPGPGCGPLIREPT